MQAFHYFLCIFFGLLLLQIARAQNGTTPASEVTALNSVFEKWGIMSSYLWNISGEPCSGIAIDGTSIETPNGNYNPGIKCKCNGTICHITHLKVYALDYTYVIPDELWTLTYLISLNLAQNYLTGPLSASIGKLTRMQYLSLGINALSGELPVELGKLTNLISLCQAFLGGSMICFGKISLRNVKVKMCLMQEILLYVSFYIHHSIFTDGDKSSWKLDAPSNIDSTVYPLLTLFKLLKTKPFQKAEFTPEELDSRKRSLNLHVDSNEAASMLPIVKRQKGCQQYPEQTKDEQAISKSSLNKLVGAVDVYNLEDELETHSKPETISIFVHYGGDRTNDPEVIAEHDVVLTTYGVLTAAYKKDAENSIFHRMEWYRVVLDEAHTIKSSRTQGAQAAFTLSSHCRWCLTGTPLHVLPPSIWKLSEH